MFVLKHEKKVLIDTINREIKKLDEIEELGITIQSNTKAKTILGNILYRLEKEGD